MCSSDLNYKRAKPFKDWLPLYRPSEQRKNAYLAENDIPEDVSLDFADFENFFEKRRARLRARLADLLNVDIFGDHSTVASDPSPANLNSVS